MIIVNILSLESNRKIKINFDEGDLSSDAGLLLIKEFVSPVFRRSTMIITCSKNFFKFFEIFFMSEKPLIKGLKELCKIK